MDAWWESGCVLCAWRGEGRLCSSCRGPHASRVPRQLEGIRGVWALGRYDEPVGRAVRRAKRRADPDLARCLAGSWARRIAPMVSGADAVVPAPSTAWSVARRGFAVGPCLAQALSQASGLPMASVLARRGGRRQSSVSEPAARRANLRGRVRAEHAPSGIVVLVDDVLTTGATAEACARELLGAGATAVWLAVVCEVPAPRRTRSVTPDQVL